MLDELLYTDLLETWTTYPILAGKIKMSENLFLYIHALLVGYRVGINLLIHTNILCGKLDLPLGAMRLFS
jgi:hypothetical protein